MFTGVVKKDSPHFKHTHTPTPTPGQYARLLHSPLSQLFCGRIWVRMQCMQYEERNTVASLTSSTYQVLITLCCYSDEKQSTSNQLYSQCKLQWKSQALPKRSFIAI